MMLFAGACNVKKFVFPENKSVNDFSVIGGISGEDAIEPGAPPICFVGCCPATAAAAPGTCIFDDDDDDDDDDDLPPRIRKLRFFFDICGNNNNR